MLLLGFRFALDWCIRLGAYRESSRCKLALRGAGWLDVKRLPCSVISCTKSQLQTSLARIARRRSEPAELQPPRLSMPILNLEPLPTSDSLCRAHTALTFSSSSTSFSTLRICSYFGQNLTFNTFPFSGSGHKPVTPIICFD